MGMILSEAHPAASSAGAEHLSFLNILFKKDSPAASLLLPNSSFVRKAHAQLISRPFLRSLSMLPQHLAKRCTTDCACSGK